MRIVPVFMRWLSLCLCVGALGMTLMPACGASSAAARLIVPGRSIGQLRLGPHGRADLGHLRKPDASDAGMSQTRQVWTSQGHTLFVHTVSNGALNVSPLNGVTLTTIRVTSPYFRTREGVHTDKTLAHIRRRFPHLHRLAASDVVGKTVLYDDTRQGIAFEFQYDSPKARCIGITVYTPGSVPAAGHPVSREQVQNLLHRS